MGWERLPGDYIHLRRVGCSFVMKEKLSTIKEFTFPRSSLHYINTVNGIVMVYANSGQTIEVAVDGKVWFRTATTLN